MPVSHIGLTVSHVPSACSFFLSALQPLGYKYVGNQGDSVGFGTDDADFFLSPEVPGITRSNAHVAFSATSKSAVRDFYASALTAGGHPNGAPAFRGCNDCIFNAAVLDLDGNSIEVIYHEVGNEDTYTTVSGRSRVLTWRRGIVNVLGDEDRSTIISAPKSRSRIQSSSASSIAESKPRTKAPNIARSVSMPTTSIASQEADTDDGLKTTGKAIMGTILGAAAGAAVAYAMVKSEQDSARQEAEFAEAMSKKAASSRASSKAPSDIAPNQAQSAKAKSVLSYVTTTKTMPATRVNEPIATSQLGTRTHRNYSTTESVVASRVQDLSDTESKKTPLSSRARSVRAIEAAPEPQQLEAIDGRRYHSPTYVSLAPTSRACKKPETEYLPASRALSKVPSRAVSKSLPRAPSVAPTERQIEYIPAAVVSQRPSIASRRTVTSPASICNTDRQIEAIPTPETHDWAPQDLVIARRDSAMSVHSTYSAKSKGRRSEHREISPDRTSRHSHRSSRHRDPSVVSRRSEATRREQSPSESSNASTIKASRMNGTAYYSAAEIPLPSSRKSSVVSAMDVPLPISRKTSMVSAADLPLPVSRKSSVVSAQHIALPESQTGSIIGSILGRSSAAGIPLPQSRKSSVVGNLVNETIPRIDDLETVAPDDSVSCVASRHMRSARSHSRHREYSTDHESRKSSSSKKHSHRHGEGSVKSSKGSEAGSDATVRRVKSGRHSTASVPVQGRSRTGIEKDEKRGQRSFVSVAFDRR